MIGAGGSSNRYGGGGKATLTERAGRRAHKPRVVLRGG